MKINTFKSVIAFSISALLSYGLYNIPSSGMNNIVCIGSFIFFIVTLMPTIGIHFNYSRTNTNIKTLSIVFFIIGLISNSLFSLSSFSIPFYVMLNGILLLVFSLATYSIFKAEQ